MKISLGVCECQDALSDQLMADQGEGGGKGKKRGKNRGKKGKEKKEKKRGKRE